MAHSNEIREFVMTDRGIKMFDVVTGPQGVLTGRARTPSTPPRKK
jgi:circadian clock protein KaiC